MRYGKPIVCLLLFMVAITGSRAQVIRIGLFNRAAVESMVFSTVEGEYIMYGNDRQIAVVRKGDIFHIADNVNGLAVHDTNQSYGVFTKISCKGISGLNIFQVRPVFPSLPPKESEGDLAIQPYNGEIQLINSLELEKYLPGCVESEGGSNALPGFYKAQAVIARTFALKSFHRHAHEGFNLCDGVHCQAYNGKSRMNREIYNATRQTAGEILVNQSGEPVTTAYHACCGGLTGSAAAEWNRNLSHLIPVHDPFCNRSVHTNWSKTIPLAIWNDYLRKSGYSGDADGLLKAQVPGRQKYLGTEQDKITKTAIRENFKLKSSYFNVEQQNGQVIIIGHGYGHGLGMCQEGAMEMARVGFTYVDILMFYFRNVTLATSKQVTVTGNQ